MEPLLDAIKRTAVSEAQERSYAPCLHQSSLLLTFGTPALRILLGCWHHLSLQPPGLSPVVEDDDVDAQLCRDLGHALPVWRTHPPPHNSLDSLAVATHCSAQSSPLVEELVGMERPMLSPGGWMHRSKPLNAHPIHPAAADTRADQPCN
jgi:hypothetical protein